MENKTNTYISFYLKKLENHIQRHLYASEWKQEFQDCSLMNMWVADFLYDNRERDVYQKDIEKEFFINRATASKMLSLMEEKQMIRRRAQETDARLKKIELLPKGMKLHEICIVVRDEMEEKLSKGFTEEEIEIFKSICRRMLLNMEQ